MKGDTITVHSTKSGSQFVRAADVIMSEQFKRDCEGIKRMSFRTEDERLLLAEYTAWLRLNADEFDGLKLSDEALIEKFMKEREAR